MDDKRRLEDGKLVLFKRGGIWQARIAVVDRRYIYRSLKTSDEAKAVTAGRRLFYQTELKIEQGLPVHLRTFLQVIDEYVAHREADHAQGQAKGHPSNASHTTHDMLRQVKRVAQFWREYAGNRPIEAIDDRVLKDFVPWRRSYYHGKPALPRNAKLNPTDKTLQWDVMLGKMIVRWAHERGYRGNKPLPTFSFAPKHKRVRPAFTINDFSVLKEKIEAYTIATDDPRQQAMRVLLHDYVLTLALSGMRVGEASNLRMRDVEFINDSDGRANVQFHVRGKTGARTVVPHIDVRGLIDNIVTRHGTRDPDSHLFEMPSGGRVRDLSEQFNAFLDYAGIRLNSSGEKYTLYSLRHFYAARAIQRDIDIYTIARNMGTSVQMIEQYYGRTATPQSRARRLGGESGQYETPERLTELLPTADQKAQ